MKNKKQSITNKIISNLLLFNVAAIFIIGIIIFSGWNKYNQRIIQKTEEAVANEVIEKINDFINIPMKMNSANHRLIESGIIDIYNESERDKFFLSILEDSPEYIYSFSYGTNKGEYFGARRNEDNNLEIMVSDEETEGHSVYYKATEDFTKGEEVDVFGIFDPRTRPWYKVAQEKEQAFFSPIYKHFVMYDLALSAAYPVYSKDGVLLGVLGTHFPLSRINDFLNDIVSKNKSKIYILENSNLELVANSEASMNFKQIGDKDLVGVKLEDIKANHIKDALDYYLNKDVEKFNLKTYEGLRSYKIINYNKDGLDWLIMIEINPKDYNSDYQQSLLMYIIVGILIIVLTITYSIKKIQSLMKPIGYLINATEEFAKGNLQERVSGFNNDEIGQLSNAFNMMADDTSDLITSLEDSIKIKGDFLANMSHEIRTPINGIFGFLQLLEMTELTEDQGEYVSTIKESTKMLLGLINDILDISKIEAGKMLIDKCEFDLYETVNSAVLSFSILAKDKGLEINYLIKSDVPRFIIGDSRRLTQIINNIISNAVKFTSEGHIYMEIEVERVLSENSIELKFIIEDTGIGMTDEELDKIFHPFIQADASSTRKYGGTGLGLSICKSLVEQMKGWIGAESIINTSSKFTFVIQVESNEVLKATKTRDDETLKDIRILIADRSSINGRILNYYLSALGAVVTITENYYDELIELGKVGSAIPYDLILFNLESSVADSEGVINILNIIKSKISIPIVLMLYLFELNVFKKDFNDVSMFDAYISKPFDKGNVLKVVKDITKTSAPTSIGLTSVEENYPINVNDSIILKQMVTSQDSKILLVEDNKTNIKFFLELMKKLGYPCDVAENGLEAVELCKSKSYKIIFMDCQMPLMDGFEATLKIRENESGETKAVIVAVTAYVMESDIIRCYSVGMNEYINKPIAIEHLKKILDQYL